MSHSVRPRERGQAAVEVVALLPLIALLAIGLTQVLMAIDSWGVAHEAARAGARAEMVGVPARQVVRTAVLGPGVGRARVRVSTTTDGTTRVRVQVPVPRLLPWLPALHAESRAEAAP